MLTFNPHFVEEEILYGDTIVERISAHNKQLDAEDSEKEVNAEDNSSQGKTVKPSSLSDCSNHPVINVIPDCFSGAGSSLSSDIVAMHPQPTDLVLSEGAITKGEG